MPNPHSNAPAGFPTENANGYPLIYPLGEGNKPTGPARLYFDGQTFEDEKEVQSYVNRLEKNKAKVFVNEFPATGEFEASVVMQPGNEAILRWMWGARIGYRMTTHRDLYFDLLKGTVHQINQAKAASDNLNPGSDTFPAPDDKMAYEVEKLIQKHRKGFPPEGLPRVMKGTEE